MDEPEPDGRRRTVSGGPLDGKPFAVSGYEVWQAWQQVRDNKGAPGVDGQSVAAFEERLEDNLYKVWNGMSAGSYFPPPVKAVEIPKAGDRTRRHGSERMPASHASRAVFDKPPIARSVRASNHGATKWTKRAHKNDLEQ